MFSQFLMVLCLVTSLMACVKVSDIENEDLVPASPGQHPSVRVVPLSEPNHYQVLLPVVAEAQVFQRETLSTNDSEFKLESLAMLIENDSLVDRTPQAGTQYRYQVGVIREGEFRELASFEVSIPQDLVVDHLLSLSQNTNWNQFHRVFLGPGGSILTNGFHFSVKAAALIAEGGTIQTHPSGVTASKTHRGKNGGSLNFEFEKAEGTLNVYLRGENGGDGLAGEAYASSPVPPYPCYPYPDFDPNGARGRRGGNGQSGGNSGSLSMQISGSHSLILNVSKEIGLGGAGGPGGPGQPGSFLGSNNSSSNQYQCVVTVQGSEGAPGDTGPAGAHGVYEKFCIKDFKGERCT